MSTADSELNPLASCIVSAANAMRVGFDGMGNKQLVTLFELLEPQLEVGSIKKRLKLQVVLSKLFEAQKRHDHIGIADCLEYELGPALGLQTPGNEV